MEHLYLLHKVDTVISLLVYRQYGLVLSKMNLSNPHNKLDVEIQVKTVKSKRYTGRCSDGEGTHTQSSKPQASRPIPLAALYPHRRVRICIRIPQIPGCTVPARAAACVPRRLAPKFYAHFWTPNRRCRWSCCNWRWRDGGSGWGGSGERLFGGGSGAVVWAGAFALFLGLKV